VRPLPVLSALALALAPLAVPAQPSGGDAAATRALASRVRAWRTAHEPEVLREFVEFLALPNLASDSAGIRRNARWIVDAFARRGVAMRLLESPAGGPPAVYGELRTPGATRTVVLYAHYDGQPVNPAQWATPPWTPTLRDGPLEAGGKVVPLPDRPGVAGDEWRVYARSAGDDKAPIVAALAALDALKASGARPGVNLKFFFEGEEEAGSGHLRPLLDAHRALLRADAWLFADGPVHQSRRQQVVFGVRGVTGLELTVYGPARPLHSGHYGNWAPNPVAMLAELLAGLRDSEGNIRVAGFMDDVRRPTAAEQAAIAAAPSPDSALRVELALGRTEGRESLAGSIMRPSLNVRGVRAGGVGATASNTIVTEASASIDFRLVPDQTPARVRELVERHLAGQGWHVVDAVPDAATRRAHPKVVHLTWEPGYPALRTPLDHPAARAVVRVLGDAQGAPPIEVPTLGGSLPLHHFAQALGAPVVIVPIANHDDAQHAADENLRLRNLWDGIESFAALFARLGTAWR
jgi:acetylornithine deacetylase/succinyl-diaminopimelate desuccinylase-like protein